MLLLACLPVTQKAEAASIDPIVDSYTAGTGSYTLKSTSRFFVVSGEEPSADLLRMVKLFASEYAADGKPSSGVLEICWGHADAADSDDIRIRLDNAYSSESYRLEITSGGVTVTAGDHSGVRYGLITLLKQMRLAGGTTVFACTIADAPDTAERTVHLDCASKYFTKDWICNFIREMSWMGYNTLEFHFSEDGGFRMDIWDPAYYTANYKPYNDFSWICGSKVQSWVGSNYKTEPDEGKYLKMDEVIEILQTAKDYNIDVIPSFDSPAHMDYLCWKYEQNYAELKSQGKDFTFLHNGVVYEASYGGGNINYMGTTGYDYPKWPDYTAIDIDTSTPHGRLCIPALYGHCGFLQGIRRQHQVQHRC